MKLNKIVQKQILQDYVYMTGVLDIDTEYFKKKIDEQVLSNDNLNGKTNVMGGMTNWHFFAKDEKFWTPFFPIQDYIEQNNLFYESYMIEEVWGLIEPKGGYTKKHKHFPSVFGGVIYLNSSDQKLFFPQIGEEIKPEPGAFAIFSGFLFHYTNRNTSNTPKYALSFNAYEDRRYI
jgi:hypothetical protein